MLVSAVSKTASKVWTINVKDGKMAKVWEGAGKCYVNHVPGYMVVWKNHQQGQIKLVKEEQLKNKSKVDLDKIPGEVIYSALEHESIEDIDLI